MSQLSNVKAVAGTTFQRYDGTNWVDIAEISDIDGPEDKASLINVTTTLSPNNQEEYIPGQLSTGAVKLMMNLVPQDPGYIQLKADIDNRTRAQYRIKAGDTLHSCFTFFGFCVSLSRSFKMGDKMAATASIQPTGGVTESHD